MIVRRLTPRGLDAANQWLDQLEKQGGGTVPPSLLDGPDLTSVHEADLELERTSFSDRFDWATYTEVLLQGVSSTDLQSDTGLWAWLTFACFDSVCPADGNGNRKVGQRARYIPSGHDFRTYYRHLLQGPWRIVHAHRDDPSRVRGVLVGPLHRPGEIAEQLTSRQELVSSATVMRLSTQLYLDTTNSRPKRGAGGSGPGSPRRLAEVLAQFDVTYDIHGMDTGRLVQMLPGEFNRFRG